jgi:ABC-2 type transport system permease protein
MRGIGTLAWLEVKLFVREPLAAFFTLVFPPVLLMVFGGIFGNAPLPEYGGFGFVDASVPAYTTLVIATSALLSLPTSVAGYRERGVLRRLQVTPLSPIAVLGAQTAVVFVMTVLGTVSLAAVALAGFGLRCAGSAVVLAGAFVLSCVSLFAVGMALAGVVTSVRLAQAIGLAVFYPMIFLSGAAIPRDLLPAGMRRAAVVLPLTHAVTLLQGLWLGDRSAAHLREIAVLVSVFVAAIAVAVRTFRWE